jgi:parallel beta-helix repeat protein
MSSRQRCLLRPGAAVSPVFLALALLCGDTGELLAAKQLYVTPTGSKKGPCSQAAPCRQIHRAVSLAAPGDTIVVADGTYQSFDVVDREATAAAPITIIAPTRGAEIRPGGEANIFVYDSAYIVLDGLRSFHAPSFAVRVSHSQHVTVRNGVYGNNGTHAIFTGHSNDLLIEDNECYGSASSHGIYLSNSGDRPVVRRNLVHDNAKAGIQLNADESEGGDGIISGALLESNVLYGNGSRSAAINLDGVQDSVVRNNLIHDNHGTAIALFRGDGASGPKGVQVLHNTLDVPPDGRTGLSIRNTAGRNVVRNNILYDRNPSTSGLKFGDSTDLANTDSDYNVVDRITPDDDATVYTLEQWKAKGHEAHSLSATPAALWVGSTAADYHLAVASPAIDQGATLASVTVDLEGNTRPSGPASDIGAYEAGSPRH